MSEKSNVDQRATGVKLGLTSGGPISSYCGRGQVAGNTSLVTLMLRSRAIQCCNEGVASKNN